MTAAQTRLGGLRKRVRPFTTVPNATIEDWTLSFRALGLLVRILRMPEGFVIRSEQLANEGKGQTRNGRKANREGREAVRTTLRELALGGYYRLEKVRLLNNTFVMQNSAAEDPDPLWAEQAAIFDGKAVPLYQQEDGTLLVRYPDGTMHPDGFPPPQQVPTSDNTVEEDEQPEEPGNGQIPETGFRAPACRAPRNLASGEAEPGDAAPFKKMVSKDGQQDSVPASQVRPGRAVQQTIDGKDEPVPRAPQALSDEAFGIANDWIRHRKNRGLPIGGVRVQHKIKDLVLPFLTARYTVNEIKAAMAAVDEGIASNFQIQRELDRIRTGRPGSKRNGRGNLRRTGADVEGDWSDVRPVRKQQVAATNTGGGSAW